MAGNDTEKLTRNQIRAIEALLTHPNIESAAAAVGLSMRTLYRYLENPVFRSELAKAEKSLIDSAGLRLIAGQEKALDALEGIIQADDTNDTNKRLAAIAWLDMVLKWRELRNVEERLAELEEVVYGKTG